jgi:ABC-type thiamine transport system substrate-binding protein
MVAVCGNQVWTAALKMFKASKKDMILSLFSTRVDPFTKENAIDNRSCLEDQATYFNALDIPTYGAFCQKFCWES